MTIKVAPISKQNQENAMSSFNISSLKKIDLDLVLLMLLALIIISICLISYLWVSEKACQTVGCDCHPKSQADLEEKIESAIAGHDGVIRLQSLTTFEWDTFHIFLPYTGREGINNSLGFEWLPENHETIINLRDGYTLLIFVRDKEVVQCIEYQGKLDFETLKRRYFKPHEAVFVVKNRQLHMSASP